MTNLNTAARAYALSLDAQCPPSPTESFEAGWEAAQGEIERLDTDAAGERAERESWKHNFKNFHRLLCERFGYAHDEKDWLRDQLSLVEHIAKKATHEPEVSRCTCIPAVTHDDYCATKSEHASRDASPADLVGALQDVVHTDPGPVRAGKAHQSASWECECEAPNNFQHESLEWCPDCGKNRPRMRTGE